jgi:hypothetical protein
MYTAYMVFAIVIVLSFVTGNIVLYTEHKFKRETLILKNDILIDEEVL